MFFPLKINKIQRETADCVSLTFDIPTEWKAKFAFSQGQYLTFRSVLDGEEVRRSYSICSAKGDVLQVAIRKIAGGLFSTFANEVLKVGDMLETMPPMGRFFTPIVADNEKNYVAFAAGSGITPIFSILKTSLEQEPKSTFTLFFGNKNAASVIFKEAIEGLKNRYMERLRVYYVLSREFQESDLFNGRLDAQKCKILIRQLLDNQRIDEVFLCGPEDMIMAVKAELLLLGLDKKQIHFELFTTAASQKNKQKKQIKTTDTQLFSTILLQSDGKKIQFPLAASGDSILDAAMNQGADLPYACKGGVCCTCKAKLVEGEVRMDINYGLEADEIADGYILTCQAHPISDTVFVNFDC